MELLPLRVLLLALVTAAPPCFAQYNGSNVRGDFGLKSGSQAPPGVYLASFFNFYGTNEIKDRFGRPLSGPGSFDVYAGGGILMVVTPKKFLGANYGFMAVPAAGSPNLELPRFSNFASGVGFADLYVQPINLGWHAKRIDAIFSYGFFAPTGRYHKDADDNVGFGMWTNEFALGSTFYLDPQKRYHAAGTAFYEIHSNKKDQNLQVGDILTLEGGLGRDFLDGAASAGAAYYCQWKVTPDGGTDYQSIPGIERTKHRFYGIGPEVNFPIVDKSKSKLIMILTFRYYWEFANISTAQGHKLFFAATFPLKTFR